MSYDALFSNMKDTSVPATISIFNVTIFFYEMQSSPRDIILKHYLMEADDSEIYIPCQYA
jgi:hypothetical protein